MSFPPTTDLLGIDNLPVEKFCSMWHGMGRFINCIKTYVLEGRRMGPEGYGWLLFQYVLARSEVFLQSHMDNVVK